MSDLSVCIFPVGRSDYWWEGLSGCYCEFYWVVWFYEVTVSSCDIMFVLGMLICI